MHRPISLCIVWVTLILVHEVSSNRMRLSVICQRRCHVGRGGSLCNCNAIHFSGKRSLYTPSSRISGSGSSSSGSSSSSSVYSGAHPSLNSDLGDRAASDLRHLTTMLVEDGDDEQGGDSYRTLLATNLAHRLDTASVIQNGQPGSKDSWRRPSTANRRKCPDGCRRAVNGYFCRCDERHLSTIQRESDQIINNLDRPLLGVGNDRGDWSRQASQPHFYESDFGSDTASHLRQYGGDGGQGEKRPNHRSLSSFPFSKHAPESPQTSMSQSSPSVSSSKWSRFPSRSQSSSSSPSSASLSAKDRREANFRMIAERPTGFLDDDGVDSVFGLYSAGNNPSSDLSGWENFVDAVRWNEYSNKGNRDSLANGNHDDDDEIDNDADNDNKDFTTERIHVRSDVADGIMGDVMKRLSMLRRDNEVLLAHRRQQRHAIRKFHSHPADWNYNKNNNKHNNNNSDDVDDVGDVKHAPIPNDNDNNGNDGGAAVGDVNDPKTNASLFETRNKKNSINNKHNSQNDETSS